MTESSALYVQFFKYPWKFTYIYMGILSHIRGYFIKHPQVRKFLCT